MQPSLGNEYARYRRIKRIPWNVQSLFAHGREGAYYTHDLSGQRHFQDFNMTPADALGDPVRIQLADNSIGNAPVAFLDGTAGCYFNVANVIASVSFAGVTDSLELEVDVTLREAAAQDFAARWVATGDNRSFVFRLAGNNTMTIYTSSDGTDAGTVNDTTSTAEITTIPGFAWGRRIKLKLSFLGNNGAGGRTYTYQYRFSDSDEWAVFASNTLAGTATIYNASAQLYFGSINNASGLVRGRVYRGVFRDGVDGNAIVDFNPSDYSGTGATWDSSTTGETWTRNGTAYIAPDGFHRVAPSDAARPQLARVPRGQELVNRLTYSEDISNAAWAKVNCTTPDFETLTPDNSAALNITFLRSQSVAKAASAQQWAMQAEVESDGYNRVQFIFNDASSVVNRVQIQMNFSDGSTLNNSANGTFSGASGAVADLGGGRYFLTLTGTTSTETELQCRVYALDSVETTGDGIKGIKVTKLQLNRGPVADYQKVTGAYDITQSGIPDLIGIYCAGSQYPIVQGSKNWTWMHDGTGGNAVMGLIVAKVDDGALDTFTGSRTSPTDVGVSVFQNDTSSFDSLAQVVISNGAENVVNIFSGDGTCPRYEPFTLSASYKIANDPDASITVGGITVASGDDTGTPSALAATYDLAIMSGPTGSNILPAYEFGSIFAQDLSAQQFRQAQRWVANRIGSDFT